MNRSVATLVALVTPLAGCAPDLVATSFFSWGATRCNVNVMPTWSASDADVTLPNVAWRECNAIVNDGLRTVAIQLNTAPTFIDDHNPNRLAIDLNVDMVAPATITLTDSMRTVQNAEQAARISYDFGFVRSIVYGTGTARVETFELDLRSDPDDPSEFLSGSLELTLHIDDVRFVTPDPTRTDEILLDADVAFSASR